MSDRELDEVLRIARRASDLVRAVYATPFTVELKGPDDPVTRADREANELICTALAASFPGDAILAEESVPESAAEVARLAAQERVWFVDPLDGTREFADKNGEFAVMIGLAVRGRAALGVVVMPVNGEAIAGRVAPDPQTPGAFAEDAGGARRPLTVSTLRDAREATIMVSRSHRPAMLDPLIQHLGIPRVVPCGSVGVKVARLVLGHADLYVHGGGGAKRWDSCAPEAVLAAAGGRFTDLAGAPIDYASADLVLRNGIIASNGALHEAVLAAVAAARHVASRPPDPPTHG
jgi:3'(2'), 5'-bisphosphate nucleotidase